MIGLPADGRTQARRISYGISHFRLGTKGERVERAMDGRLVVINGRFASQDLSGVQRYATELVCALDRLLTEGAARQGLGPFELHVPKGSLPNWPLRAIIPRETGRLFGHAWEQFELARTSEDAVLLSLCNTGPIRHGRHVVVIHDAAILLHPENYSFLFRSWYRALYHGFAARARRLATVSHAAAEDLRKRLPITGKSLDVIPNAADQFERIPAATEFVELLGLERGRFVLVVGSASRTKNTEMVARAVTLLPAPRPPLVWVGGTRPHIFGKHDGMRRTADLILSRLSDHKLKALYRSALCLIVPSLYEGFGLPALEAMTCDCPVIASNIPALKEVCGNAALYFDPHDCRALAGIVADLRGKPEMREALKAKGRERASAFRWERSARALLSLLQEAAR